MAEYQKILDLLKNATPKGEEALLHLAGGFLQGKLYPEDSNKSSDVLIVQQFKFLMHLGITTARAAAIMLYMPSDVSHSILHDYGDLNRVLISDVINTIVVRKDGATPALAIAAALMEYYHKLADKSDQECDANIAAPLRKENGDVLHGCKICDGEDACTCPGNVDGRKTL